MSSDRRGWPGIIMTLASAICFSTFAIFVKLAFAHHLMDWNNLPLYAEIPLAAWLTMLGAAVVGTYIALLLYFGATHTALICTIEPVSTTLQAAWILGERMTPWQIFGAALILAGLIALEWPNGGGRKAESKGARTFLSAMRVDSESPHALPKPGE